jgi:phasin
MSANDPFSVVPPFQVPERVRAFAEKGVSEVQDRYAKLMDVAESNNGAFEAACTSATKGAGDLTAKLVDIARVNAESAFDFAHSLLGVKSLPEAFELVNAHARKQFETLTAQSRELAELGQKVATETAEPIKASAVKTFRAVS